MKLTLDKIIKKLKTIETNFNNTDDPTKRYALLQALNHIGEKEIPFHGYWEDAYLKSMLKEHGADPEVKKYE